MNKPSAEAMKAARELLPIPPQYISIEEGARALDTFAAKARAMAIEEAATIALEQRCERETPWDLACTTIAAAIRALA